VEVVRLPARSPNLNAFAGRFVLSIRSECLDRIVPLGERHLRRAVSEFVAHYHHERNHQGLENRLIEGPHPRTAMAESCAASVSGDFSASTIGRPRDRRCIRRSFGTRRRRGGLT
jgi:hypothetical protein